MVAADGGGPGQDTIHMQLDGPRSVVPENNCWNDQPLTFNELTALVPVK